MKRIQQRLHDLKRFVDQWWYSPLMGFFAGIDHYVIFFPIDAMFISTVLVHPKKWKSISFWFAFGSATGAASLAALVGAFGISLIQSYFPAMLGSPMWGWTQSFFNLHGLWVVLLSGLLPMPQQPAMIISSLAEVALWKVSGAVFLGRFFKFFTLGGLVALAPDQLKKMRPIRHEMEEFGEPLDPPKSL